MDSLRGLERNAVFDYENAFYWFSESRRLAKACAQYDLYKKIIDLPGDVIEFGVYKATSLIRLATYREILETARSREIHGFDVFGQFPRDGVSAPSDLAFIDRFEHAGGEGLSAETVQKLLDAKMLSSNVDLISGDIRETLPHFLVDRPEVRFALMHLDIDVYEPTHLALEMCWPRLVPGGIIMIDDFNMVGGASKAVDEFISRNGLRLSKSPIAHSPTFIER